MRIEHSNQMTHLWIIGLLYIVVSSIVVIPLLQTEKLQTNWKMTFAQADEVFKTGQTIDLHFFLEDESGTEIENATMKAVFDRNETVHQIEKEFHYLEDGLYETEVVFSVPGTWIVMLEAKKGSSAYRNQFLIQVEGPIVAEESRDPADHFELDQPLPSELERELDHFPRF